MEPMLLCAGVCLMNGRYTLDGDLHLLGLTRGDIEWTIFETEEDPGWTKRNEAYQGLLRSAQRKVMLSCHPDRHPEPESVARAQEVNAAADRLSKVVLGPPRPAPMVVFRVVGFPGWGSSATSTNTTSSFGGWSSGGWW